MVWNLARRHLSLLHLSDYCVAKSQVLQKVDDIPVVWMGWVSQMLIELRVEEVEVGGVRWYCARRVHRAEALKKVDVFDRPVKIRLLLRAVEALVKTVIVIAYGHFLELHVVFGEGTRLVRENKVDLAKRFVEIARLDTRLLPRCQAHHVDVPLHEETLHEADRLDRHYERDGHQIA